MTPDFSFSREQVAKLRRNLVYVLKDERDNAVYVGAGRCIARPFDPAHHAISRVTGSVDVYSCVSRAEALALERHLIDTLRPALNARPGITERKSSRAERGIIRNGRGWRAFVKTGGRLLTKCFPDDTPIETILAWRESVKLPGTWRRARAVH
jgi:hypothetical protein